MEQPWYKNPHVEYKNLRATVIGGGLAGTSVAFSLAKRGWKIKIIERSNRLASGASGNDAGIISPLISHKNDVIGKFFLEGFLYTIRHLEELVANFNIKRNLCGVLELSDGKINKNIEELVISKEFVEKLSSKNASELVGCCLKSDALIIKNGGWVSPVDLCNANIEAYQNNIEIIYNSEAIELSGKSDKWIVNSECGVRISESDIIVLANSNDANKFLQTSWLPLIPVRGQVTNVASDEIKTSKVLCYEGGYVIPEIDGIHYVGATYDRGSLSTDSLPKDDEENIDNLKSVIDINSYKIVGSRAALRSTSPDRRPMIGAVAYRGAFLKDYADIKHGKVNKAYPDGKYQRGLYVSTGFGSRGITSCPIAGEIIACMINNEPLPIDKKIIDAVNPARFIIRQLKQG